MITESIVAVVLVVSAAKFAAALCAPRKPVQVQSGYHESSSFRSRKERCRTEYAANVALAVAAKRAATDVF